MTGWFSLRNPSAWKRLVVAIVTIFAILGGDFGLVVSLVVPSPDGSAASVPSFRPLARDGG